MHACAYVCLYIYMYTSSVVRRGYLQAAFDYVCSRFCEDYKNFIIWEKQLMLFEDGDGFQRCLGRIDKTPNLPFTAGHPILLPSNDSLTTLYMNQLMLEFMVVINVGGTKESESYMPFHLHLHCQVWVSEAPPFSSTGIDFAIHLYVTNSDDGQFKYGLCCVTRAIHLDLMREMSAITFI